MDAEGLEELRDRASEFVSPCLRLMEALVGVESPSSDVDRNLEVAAVLRGELERKGASVERHSAPGYGEHLVARVEGESRSGAPLLVVGHMDTVYAVGTLARLPFAIEVPQDRVSGPGTYDMKGGLAVAITALDLLSSVGRRPAGDLLFLITCDEELGSPTSQGLIGGTSAAGAGGVGPGATRSWWRSQDPAQGCGLVPRERAGPASPRRDRAGGRRLRGARTRPYSGTTSVSWRILTRARQSTWESSRGGPVRT